MAENPNKFTFEISLSVLNHLGRNLYRSFMTVLGEAISNSWDADAENVWISIDNEKNTLMVVDDGIGMDKDDFQNKFLKIGYSKRINNISKSNNNRPFIGRKGIGKLALLSCSNKITVISKTKTGEWVGGVVDNSDLDQAIIDDKKSTEYFLNDIDIDKLKDFTSNIEKGTIIIFEGFKSGINHRIEYLEKLIALQFRFSLYDEGFNIYLNGNKITLENLNDLAQKTQFLWIINNFSDPYIDEKLVDYVKKHKKSLTLSCPAKGFIASVDKPSSKKISNTSEIVGIDLFVNGRLREKDIYKHFASARVVANYLYGQIHFDDLDDEVDRFTSSREGIKADDPKFNKLLDDLKGMMESIYNDWDVWRRELNQDGDLENETNIKKKERKSEELFNLIASDYTHESESDKKDQVDEWVKELQLDAQFNFTSYGECFVSENLIRKHIDESSLPLSKEAENNLEEYKKKEQKNMEAGNISIEIRKENKDLSYLSMDDLANLVDKDHTSNKEAHLSRDAKEYKPIRDAIAHTALVTDEAKGKLTSVFNNIKARVKALLSCV